MFKKKNIVKAVVVYGPMEIIKVHLFVTSETHKSK